MKKIIDKKGIRLRRAVRTRAKIKELEVARLTVHRTPRHIYAQVIAAEGGKVLATASTAQGDIAKGRSVFERAESSCVLCHRIGDKGADFGPGLGEIGAKLPKEQIYENIINPSAGLSMGFETTQLTLKDGSTALGIVRSDTRNEVVLALPGGATNRFEKGQIAKREKLTTSMMPSGLNQLLSQDDLVNLVEYLASLKTK